MVTIQDVLFVFCKLNPDVGYRQGMHEILAPVLWVVETEAIDLGISSKALGEEAIVTTFFDSVRPPSNVITLRWPAQVLILIDRSRITLNMILLHCLAKLCKVQRTFTSTRLIQGGRTP